MIEQDTKRMTHSIYSHISAATATQPVRSLGGDHPTSSDSEKCSAEVTCSIFCQDKGAPPKLSMNKVFVNPIQRVFLLAFFFLVTAATPASQIRAQQAQLSAPEKKIINYLDAHAGEAVNLLEKTVNIESPTENISGVKEVGDVLRAEFDALGFSTRWVEMPAEMKRAGHLVAEHSGSKGKRILLLGHLDTVLSGERFRLDGRKAMGTGAADMKAGDLVLYFALKALHATGNLKDARIIVIYTGDEENSGDPIETSRGEMVAAARRSDLALSFENGGSGIATVARRGSSTWRLVVTASTGHSSQIFKDTMGSGAIFEAARILNKFYEELRFEKYLTFNPALIAGGTEVEEGGAASLATARGKTNVVPGKVLVNGDLRFISEAQKADARLKMREIVAKNLPGTTARISFSDGIPAMPPNAGNYELLKQLDRVSQDLGMGRIMALDPGERGAGDIAFVAHLLPSLDGLGATGGKAHARGEYADLETLPGQIKRAALLIYRLTLEPGGDQRGKVARRSRRAGRPLAGASRGLQSHVDLVRDARR